MNVSLKHTKNNKHGKLSKAAGHITISPLIGNAVKVNRGGQGKANSNQKMDLKISSKGVAVLGKKSSCEKQTI